MKKKIYTGGWALKDPDHERYFGNVTAFGALDNGDQDTLRLFFNNRFMKIDVDDGTVTIDIPKAWGHILANELKSVICKLECLRLLRKNGELMPGTLEYDYDEDIVLEQAASNG